MQRSDSEAVAVKLIRESQHISDLHRPHSSQISFLASNAAMCCMLAARLDLQRSKSRTLSSYQDGQE